MNRRKTKTERELIADLNKCTTIFCEKQGRCKNCPLYEIKEKHCVGCMEAYLIYLIQKECN